MSTDAAAQGTEQNPWRLKAPPGSADEQKTPAEGTVVARGAGTGQASASSGAATAKTMCLRAMLR